MEFFNMLFNLYSLFSKKYVVEYTLLIVNMFLNMVFPLCRIKIFSYREESQIMYNFAVYMNKVDKVYG